MIKESDKDEKEFVKQIKVDIESYYRENPKYIIFFIYDPQKKTINKNNFYDFYFRSVSEQKFFTLFLETRKQELKETFIMWELTTVTSTSLRECGLCPMEFRITLI